MDDDMAELLVRLRARRVRDTPTQRRAGAAVRQAFDHYERTGNAAAAVKAALLPHLWQRRWLAGAAGARLAMVQDGSLEYGLLNAALGLAAGVAGDDDERAQEAFRRARDVAERLG